jgi:hypothetical protein
MSSTCTTLAAISSQQTDQTEHQQQYEVLNVDLCSDVGKRPKNSLSDGSSPRHTPHRVSETLREHYQTLFDTLCADYNCRHPPPTLSEDGDNPMNDNEHCRCCQGKKPSAPCNGALSLSSPPGTLGPPSSHHTASEHAVSFLVFFSSH